MVSCQTEVGAIIAIVCLIYVQNATGQETTCDTTHLDQCGPNETCQQKYPDKSDGSCECKPGYIRDNSTKSCVLPPSSPTISPDSSSTVAPSPASTPTYNSSHIAAGILIPLLFVILMLGVFYAARRYQWIQRLRSLRQRRYDEVQFGQEDDDPPLA